MSDERRPIQVEDIEALAAKLDGMAGLDGHDREVLTAVFVLAGMSSAPEAEVRGFGGLMCTCVWVEPSGPLLFSPTCPVPNHSSVGGYGNGFSFGAGSPRTR